MSADTHEIVSAFAQAGLDLHGTLREMLDEHPAHRTERRGCGYTQASRFLSTFINQPRRPDQSLDFGLFAEWPKARTEALARQAIAAGWARGWRRLDRCDPAMRAHLLPESLAAQLATLPKILADIEAGLQHEESRLLMTLIRQILAPEAPAAPSITEMSEKPEIGSCSRAEEFFLEIAHGRVRRNGRVNVFVDNACQPLLVEKLGLGESHSAMAVAPVTICDVVLPPGSLFALRYPDETKPKRDIACGHLLPIEAITQARFLRLTTLAVSTAIRRRAFSAQFEAQLRGDMLSPASTTIDDLRQFALDNLARG
ncbi:MAG: hypothetical protein HOP03_01245 [Lysobacter sp.]|nr:hypothetical protein [Lysobacter sp.]